MTEAVRAVTVVHVGPAGRESREDLVAVEEPVDGRVLLTTMRTPGADRELALGLLLSERVVWTPDDIGTVEVCRDADRRNVVNVSLVEPASGRARAADASRRLVSPTSACGVCGRQSIDDLRTGLPGVEQGFFATASAITSCPDRLRGAQPVFAKTGGLHAAALVTGDGAVVAVAEDVGRHNAVDKVIGAQLLADRFPLSDVLLFVSGRTSFEIVQKAGCAGIPMVASVSAPSSLAVELADELGITLVGFVRGASYNVYTHPERVRG
jgi:FdhD protein